ncbi:hypothetical protein SAMN05216428_11156 [Nitrosospira sp. Nsp11]|nr:hypothetical protein SAMN05216315_1279 [Nitrosospira sp. Nsp18]SHM00426.1 hypothetical protein SAMN05216428_11156 [Nitrosospira sp. Nsp11]
MKEIVIMGGIAAHRGYLITEALFAANPSLARSFAYRTYQAWPAGCLYPGIPCAKRFGYTSAMKPDMAWLMFQLIASGAK